MSLTSTNLAATAARLSPQTQTTTLSEVAGARLRNLNRPWIFGTAVIITALSFAAVNTYSCMKCAEFPPYGGDVKNIIQMLQKWDDPTLFSRDFVFSDNGYRLYVPAYMQLVRWIDRLSGIHDYERSVQLLQFPICIAFVLSMTWLLHRLTHQRWLSLAIAVASTLSVEIIYGNLTYSVGVYTTPRFLHLALTPLLFGWLLFHGEHRVWGPLAFLAAGLSSNLQFGSGVAVTAAMGMGWVLHDLSMRRLARRLSHWTLCGVMAIAGALPYYLAFRAGQTPGAAPVTHVDPVEFNRMVHTRLQHYPIDVFIVELGWPRWAIDLVRIWSYTFPFLVLGCVALRSRWPSWSYGLLMAANAITMCMICADAPATVRWLLLLPVVLLVVWDVFRTEPPGTLRWVLAFSMFGIQGLGMLFSMLVIDAVYVFHRPIPQYYFDLGVAAKLAPFLMNIYAALLAAELWSSLRQHVTTERAPLRRTIGTVLLLVLLSSIGFRFWKTPYNGYAHFRRLAAAIVSGAPLYPRAGWEDDYREATAWARSHAPRDARFLVVTSQPRHDFMFRYKAERSMWACEKDGGMSFYKGRAAFIDWYDEIQARQQALGARNAVALADYARSRDVDYLFVDRGDYDWLEHAGTPVFSNRHYRILRLP